MKLPSLIIVLLLFGQSFAQNIDFKEYLILGVDRAEELASAYTEPLNEGLMYALSGGWYNSARVKKKWNMELSLVTVGSFVPSEKQYKELDLSKIENLDVVGSNSNIVRIPTILGSTSSNVRFAATVDGETYEFDAPTGIGLFKMDLLPSPFLQLGLGLPASFEITFRYFPKVKIDEGSVGAVGVGLKHEFTKSINRINEWPLAISAMMAYTRLDAKYNFQADGFVKGDSQSAKGYLNTMLFEMIASSKNPIYNVYGGLGYVIGRSQYDLNGNYIIELDNKTLEFHDPFSMETKISGVKLSVGANVNISSFSINLDYTFQGYNNLALGINYKLRNK
ncbi:DUF6588 family protein [Gaetbulibacter saemankumensis]|uniref:DUF6588 family protein n=1 Tax=Gaetbulibacter saemankumensis TaxID=311208 RepID=UPI0012FA0DB6|nr:DUF6588 family protein [Gaetbulibacter saemankumensis]